MQVFSVYSFIHGVLQIANDLKGLFWDFSARIKIELHSTEVLTVLRHRLNDKGA